MLSLVRRLGPTTSAQLARWLRVSAQSAGEMLKALESRGLVQRGTSDANRRIVLLSLTPAGRRVAQLADGLVADAEEQFFSTLRPRERSGFDQTIQRLRHAAEPHDQPV
jgi:DNA-binding MarR family transcriptional regulator